MKVTITESAEASLGEIYFYKCDYSIQQADAFLDMIYDFTIKNLSTFPKLGRLYNEAKGLYRLVHGDGYNIYYTIGVEEVFVLYIIDGAMSLNQRLEEPNVRIPSCK